MEKKIYIKSSISRWFKSGLFVMYILGLSGISYGQEKPDPFVWLAPENLSNINVKGFTATSTYAKKKSSFLNGLVLEKAIFNSSGDLSSYFRYNFDVVNNTDSVIYSYDENKNLVEVKTFSKDVPDSKEQKDFAEEVGAEGHGIEIIRYRYNDQNQCVRREYYYREKSKHPDVEEYTYNGQGLRVKTSYSYTIQPEYNNITEWYAYDASNRLIETKTVYAEHSGDTNISTISYNEAGQLLKEHVATLEKIVDINYFYDEAGRLIKKKFSGIDMGFGVNQRVEYFYNINGKLTEVKTYKNGLVSQIKVFKYNALGLKIEELQKDPETGKPFRVVSISYDR